MTIRAQVASLLQRRGYVLTDAVLSALDDFLAIVRSEGADSDADEDPDEEDEEESENEESENEDEDQDEDAADGRSHAIACPHCGERIAIAIDLSGEDQDDVQDCTVCCSPIRVTYSVEDGRLASFSAEPC
ncbi:MAG: CPXCG motif-containing cysteine-rich protein [Planctomycetes bacterium]|nr:CPXCG motif-containing cysteine-rich protein [Planctomycetota bacterium]